MRDAVGVISISFGLLPDESALQWAAWILYAIQNTKVNFYALKNKVNRLLTGVSFFRSSLSWVLLLCVSGLNDLVIEYFGLLYESLGLASHVGKGLQDLR